MTAHFDLFTTNYSRFKPEMGAPIQASNGKPRHGVSYELTLSCKEIYPPWALVKGHAPYDAFKAGYFEHLDSVGVDKIASRFRALATAAGESRLVLLCFEAIDRDPDNWCHRTMFAEWWTAKTGDPVRELGPAAAPRDPMLF